MPPWRLHSTLTSTPAPVQRVWAPGRASSHVTSTAPDLAIAWAPPHLGTWALEAPRACQPSRVL